MRTLLIGGAGYIGSSITHHLLDLGHEPFVLDNLSTGARAAEGRDQIEGALLRHQLAAIEKGGDTLPWCCIAKILGSA